MRLYNDRIINVGDNFNNNFPERFSNEIYLSNVDADFYFKYTSPFSIKYVLKGQENYRTGTKMNEVGRGQALIINQGTEVVCEKIRSQSPGGLGMSIFLDNDVINDAVSV